jgi:hypothetical protein
MRRTLGILGILVIAFLLAAGCTQTGGNQTTPAPTAAPETPLPTVAEQATTISSTGGGSLIPGPTETIPVNEAVTVTVEKAGTYSTTIIASFDGGKGINFVSRCDVKVTRPDGSVVTGSLKPMMGDTVELEGTKGADRVEVTAYMKSGKTYKVIDELFSYKTRG